MPPSRLHFLGLSVAILFAGFYTAEGILFKDYNLDEFQVATGYLKDLDSTLFPKDFIWSKPEMVRNLHVCVRALMDFTNKLTFGAVQEPIDLYLIWLPIAFLLFFAGNYLLSYEFTKNSSASLLVACCFMLVRRTVWDWWGIGPTYTMSARGLVLTLLPLGLWAFFRCQSNFKKLAVFSLGWGFISNFHPLSGWGFMEFLGLTILIVERFRSRAFLKVFVMAVGVILGSLPFLIIWNKVAIVPHQFQPDPSLVKQFLDYYQFLQPDTNRYVRGFLWDLSLPFLISLVGYFYFRSKESLKEDVRLKMSSVFPFVAVGTVVGVILLGTFWNDLRFVAPVMATEHSRNIKMVYLTLPIWMGFGFTWWLQRKSNEMMKWGVAVLVVILSLIINLPGHKFVRHVFYRMDVLSEKSSQKIERNFKEDADDLELSLWARGNTSMDALFYFDSYEFRYYARRSLVFCSFDRPCVAFHPSQEMKEWNDRLNRIGPLKKEKNSIGMMSAAKEYGADYLVLLNSWQPIAEMPVWSNAKYSVFAVPKS